MNSVKVGKGQLGSRGGQQSIVGQGSRRLAGHLGKEEYIGQGRRDCSYKAAKAFHKGLTYSYETIETAMG